MKQIVYLKVNEMGRQTHTFPIQSCPCTRSYNGNGRLLCPDTHTKEIITKKIKAEELWRSWFTVNEMTKPDKFVSENEKSQQKKQNQPIGA